jgi:hypothetical protein
MMDVEFLSFQGPHTVSCSPFPSSTLQHVEGLPVLKVCHDRNVFMFCLSLKKSGAGSLNVITLDNNMNKKGNIIQLHSDTVGNLDCVAVKCEVINE